MAKLSNQPYKGTKDFFPEDYRVLRYIFDTWRRVCESYGYEEYQTPLLENAEIYRAKSGEELGGKELFTLRDLKDRELAIRPEMTPSVTRMVSTKYKELPKPIRLFNIGSFYRNERPQRGRNREFWQLNADIFGEDSCYADLEVILLAIDLMKAFNAPDDSFKVLINDRRLIDFVLSSLEITGEKITEVVRAMDKFKKTEAEDFRKMLGEKGLSAGQIEKVERYLTLSVNDLAKEYPGIEETEGYKTVGQLMASLSDLGLDKYAVVTPGLVRGFDYYDGMIFEVFDTKTENSRSLFGGGRYNGLAELFGSENFSAVGFAPGNETMRIFLESWDLLPNFSQRKEVGVFVVALPAKGMDLKTKSFEIAREIRKLPRVFAQVDVTSAAGGSQALANALRYADKKDFDYVLILGEEEARQDKVTLRNLKTGEQETSALEELFSKVI